MSPRFLCILTSEVSLGHQAHTLKMAGRRWHRGESKLHSYFFAQEGHLDVPFLNGFIWRLAHSVVTWKSVETQFKAGEKLWQIRSLLQKKLCYNFSHSLATAVCRYSKYYRCSCCERTSLTSGFDWGWMLYIIFFHNTSSIFQRMETLSLEKGKKRHKEK